MEKVDPHPSKPDAAAAVGAERPELDETRQAILYLLEDLEENRRRTALVEQDWSSAFDAVDDLMFVHDEQCRIVRANRAYAERARLPMSNIVGRPYWEVFPRGTGPQPGCAKSLKEIRGYTEQLRLPTGEIFLLRTYPIVAHDNGMIRSLHILQDVTEARRNEDRLRAMGQVLDQAGEGVVVLDAALTITYVNPALSDLLGREPSNLVGKHVGVLSGNTAGDQTDRIRNAVDRGSKWSGEIDVLAADGSRIPTFLHATALRNGSGELEGYVGTYLDLRPVKHTMQQLETLRAVIERLSMETDLREVGAQAIEAAVALSGAEFGAVALFDAASGLLQYRWSRGLDTRRSPAMHSSFCPGEGIGGQAFQTGRAQLVGDYANYGHAFASYRAYGVKSALAVPILIGDEPVGALTLGATGECDRFQRRHVPLVEAIARQLGIALHRQRLMDDLRHSEARFRQVVETVPDILFVLRLPELQPSLVSPSVHELLGFTPDEVLSEPGLWRRQMFRADRRRVIDEVSAAIESSAGYAHEVRFWHKDHQTLRWFEARGVIDRDEQGRPYGITGVLTDITARKNNEHELILVNRALATLTSCNEALVRAVDEPTLLARVCDSVVQHGGYAMAWVGYADTVPARTIRPVAHAGADRDYLNNMPLAWDGGPDQGAAGRAVQTGRRVVIRDIALEPHAGIWREAARARGHASAIALPVTVEGDTIGVLMIFASEVDAFDSPEVELLSDLADDLAYGIKSLRARTERARAETARMETLVATIEAVARTVEKRDPYTAGHQQRVAELSVAIAGELGLDADVIQGLRLGALIHDIGKVYIPSEILNRPGRLSEAEFQLIKTHSQVGYDIIKDVEFPWPVAQMVLQHHERLDGSGYPYGLQGDEICLEARILAVADVVEAITSHRPYRPGHGIDDALAEIRAHAGSWYDSAVVAACTHLFDEHGYAF
jgi:PAS domain S-box-containing protein/putative nucleotidyltransferase with HDIG domain